MVGKPQPHLEKPFQSMIFRPGQRFTTTSGARIGRQYGRAFCIVCFLSHAGRLAAVKPHAEHPGKFAYNVALAMLQSCVGIGILKSRRESRLKSDLVVKNSFFEARCLTFANFVNFCSNSFVSFCSGFLPPFRGSVRDNRQMP
jgi:hypothetical protein